MLTSLLKRLSIKIVLSYVTFLLLTFWIPLVFWGNQISFSAVTFSTEFYKNLVDIGKILFGFWLANIFFQKQKQNEFSEFFKSQWKTHKGDLFCNILELETIPSTFNVHITILIESIEKNDNRLSYLTEIFPMNNHDEDMKNLVMEVTSYKEKVHPATKNILISLKAGNIIHLRPFDEETNDQINEIKQYIHIKK